MQVPEQGGPLGVVPRERRTADELLEDRGGRARPPLPDLFRDGVEVEVRGTLAGDTLVADEVLTIPRL